jgi:hypothetical protein
MLEEQNTETKKEEQEELKWIKQLWDIVRVGQSFKTDSPGAEMKKWIDK